MEKDLRLTDLRPDLRFKKVMLLVRCDSKSLIHWELLPTNETADRYVCLIELHRTNQATQERKSSKKGRIILPQDNTRPHTANVIKDSPLDFK